MIERVKKVASRRASPIWAFIFLAAATILYLAMAAYGVWPVG